MTEDIPKNTSVKLELNNKNNSNKNSKNKKVKKRNYNDSINEEQKNEIKIKETKIFNKVKKAKYEMLTDYINKKNYNKKN